MEKGLQEDLIESIKNKHNPCTQLLLDWCLNYEYNKILSKIVFLGWTDMVDNLYRLGANNFNEVMIIATKQGRYSILPVLIRKGGNNLNQCLIIAAKKGKLGIVSLMVNKGANAFDKAIDAVFDNMFGTEREIKVRLRIIDFLEKRKKLHKEGSYISEILDS